ncbi:MAG TPA: tetratricopeptide repeat protein [Candidatus Sulfotelmatobacter sp.]|nr:tetratricopeptide repeat protein [Candidatus Sulfotelmatobacter sp.]
MPPLPLTHPAFIAGIAVAAAMVIASVTTYLTETDFWQHLLVGRAIWTLHRVPTTELWTWPTHGAPDVNASWGFRALIWPLWKLAGVWGLFGWRWITTLAAFAIAWLTARRMGARGFAPLVVVLFGAALYRLRSQIRPETLAVVLLALEIWILETRRHGGRDRAWALVPLALLWANCHISYFLFFVVLGIHALNDALGGGAPGVASPATPSRDLPLIGLASLLAMLLNPWGWRALAQPFEYFFVWRHEPIFLGIGELQPPRWIENFWNGLPLVAAATPLLFLWRWRRRGLDRVELLMVLSFGAMAASSLRFLGFLAIAVVPYLSRDLDDWLATRRWPLWSALPALRATAVGAVAMALLYPQVAAPDAALGVGILWHNYPVAACDYIAKHDVRGRSFNSFDLGGYLLYRFWPDSTRLPFIDIHQAGTREDRLLYVLAQEDPRAWARLDGKYRFDWILLGRKEVSGFRLMDTLDSDSTWALVFVDDATVMYTRRAGPLERLAPLAFHELRAGREGLRALGQACASDPVKRERVRMEFERAAELSSANAGTNNFLASIALMDGRREDAARHLHAALAADPMIPHAHERLGDLAMDAGRWREAIGQYRQEAAVQLPSAEMMLRMGSAWNRLGDRGKAREAFHDALELDPSVSAARDSLDALDHPS